MEVEFLLGDGLLFLIGGGPVLIHGRDGAEDERRKIKNARRQNLGLAGGEGRALGEARDKGVDDEAVLEAVAALVELEALLLLAGALDGRYAAAGG